MNADDSQSSNHHVVARKRIRRKPGSRVKISLPHPSSSSSNSSPALRQRQLKQAQTHRSIAIESPPTQQQNQAPPECSHPQQIQKRQQQQIESKEIYLQSCQCSCHIHTASEQLMVERPNRLESGLLRCASTIAAAGPRSGGLSAKHRVCRPGFNGCSPPTQCPRTPDGSQLDPARSISRTATNGSVSRPAPEAGQMMAPQQPPAGGDGRGAGQTTELTLNDNLIPNSNRAAGREGMGTNFSVDNQIFGNTNNMEAGGQSNGEREAAQMEVDADDNRHSSSLFVGADARLRARASGGDMATDMARATPTDCRADSSKLASEATRSFSAELARHDPTAGAGAQLRHGGLTSDNERRPPELGGGCGAGGDNKLMTTLTNDTSRQASGLAKTNTFAAAAAADCYAAGGAGAATKCRRCEHCANIRLNGCSGKQVATGGSLSGSEINQSSGSPSPSLTDCAHINKGNSGELAADCRNQQHNRQCGGRHSVPRGGCAIGPELLEHQHSPASAATTCADLMLDDCCGCCCGQSTELARSTPFASPNHELEEQQQQQQQEVTWLARPGETDIAAAPEAPGAGGPVLNSQIVMNERGLINSELVVPPGVDPANARLARRCLSTLRGLIRGHGRQLPSAGTPPELAGRQQQQAMVNTMLVASDDGRHRALVVGGGGDKGCALCAHHHLGSPVNYHLDLRSAGGSIAAQVAAEESAGDDAGLAIAASTAAIAVTTVSRPPVVTNNSVQTAAEGLESKRERKAAKTLAIITGVFVMCWLPFFVMAITMSLLNLRPHKYVFALMLWLGYVNSMLNPIIYTIFSPDFRVAFKRLLCGLDSRADRRDGRGASGQCRLNHSSHKKNFGNSFDNSSSRLIRVRQQISRLPPMFVQCCLSNSIKAKATTTSNSNRDSHQYVLSPGKNTTTSGSGDNNNNLRNHLLNLCAPKNEANPANNEQSRIAAATGGIGPSSGSLDPCQAYDPAQTGSQQLSSSSDKQALSYSKLAAKEHGNIIQSPGRPQSSNIINDF